MFKFGINNAFRRKSTLIIALIGTGLGVGLMTTLLSLSEGMDKRLTDTTNQVAGDIEVTATDAPLGGIGAVVLGGGTPLPIEYQDQIRDIPHVQYVSSSVTAMIPKESFRTPGIFGSSVNGIDPDENSKIDGVVNHITEGRVFTNAYELIIGKEAKKRAEWEGQEVTLGMEITVPVIKKNGGSSSEVQNTLPMSTDSLLQDQGLDSEIQDNEEFEQTTPEGPNSPQLETKTITLTIVGIFNSGNSFRDNLFYTDLTTARELAQLEANQATSFSVRVEDTDYVEEVAEQIEAEFNTLPIPVKTSIAKDILGNLNETLDIFDTFLLVIALVASIAGGMSILIIMLMNVTERMKEFGILKAAGWSNRNIVWSVLVESITVSFLGAGVGFGVGYGVVYALNYYLDNELGVITWDLVVGVISFGIVMGVIGGIYPAIRAARVSPMSILRGD